MANISLNAASLLDAARKIEDAANRIDGAISRIDNTMSDLDAVWSDQNSKKYLSRYEELKQEYIDAKYDLVITVDNGITAFEPIELLHNNGVKVLILDHHQTQDTVPVADAICHPIYSHFYLPKEKEEKFLSVLFYYSLHY